jgi:transcriptional regulator with XRE-family HTH domain
MSHRHHTLTRFGLNVRRRRKAAGLSQEALAEKAELDRTYISGVERGTRLALEKFFAVVTKKT